MKICFVGPASSGHIKKWAVWFSQHGHEVHVVSFDDGEIEGCTVHHISNSINTRGKDGQKIKYLFQAKKVYKIVNEINPNVINAHYATSYGSVCALAGLKNYYVSVWGSDVYEFPNKSIFHKALLKYSLKKAKYLFSTSKAMAEEAKKYTDKEFYITPFGVDMDLFSPDKRTREDDGKFIIGTVKLITPKYGIDYLLKAVALIVKDYPEIPIYVRIAGKGESEEEYKQLTRDLGIEDRVSWLGFISQEEAAKEWANFDIGVVTSSSSSESFGVSAVECESCATPVIISDVPGLMEATSPNNSSIVVPRRNEVELAKAIVDLYNNKELRKQMGEAGRKFVSQMYELNKCFENIEEIYISNL